MSFSRTIAMADLFCGAGGTSTGAIQAIRQMGYEAKVTAVNHWPVAVATHEANHPGARHLCAAVDSLNPRHLFKEGELNILWGSPECTHHSRARGGKPMQDQSRSTAWCVTRWAEALLPDYVFVENVPEFVEWGPLGVNGKPLASRKGQTFKAWIQTLISIGYRVDYRILCAADYGDPTTRRRLIVQAVRGKRRVTWPEPTHLANREPDLLRGELPRWRAARDIIDWTIPGHSIYARKRPLAPKTMARIMEGLRRYGLKPSIVAMEHGGRVCDVDRPMPTITTARGGAFGVTQAFLLPQHFGTQLRPVDEPVPTVCGSGCVALVEPFLVSYYGNGEARDINNPLDTVTTRDRFGLAQPEVVVDGERYRMDVRFRMLTPGELAKAQGFPGDYQFTGTKTEQVKQIGNAVPCGLSRALVGCALRQRYGNGI